MTNFLKKHFMPPEEGGEKVPEPKEEELIMGRAEIIKEIAPEARERKPDEIEKEKREEREALEKEAREMLLTPEQEEVAIEEKKQIPGLNEFGKDKRLLDLAEKHGYLFAIHVLLHSEPFDPYALDRLHSYINNPEYAHLQKKS